MWVWMNKKLSESPTPSSIACIWTIHGCKGLTMRSESRNSLSNFKEIQTCFDISEQKDGCIQLLVYCSSISSNFDCSELRVKKRRKKNKKGGQEVTDQDSKRLAELGPPQLYALGNLALQRIMLSAGQHRESSLQFSRLE